MSRAPFMPREKAAYTILRRKQVSINEMAKAFGRSTSQIHKFIIRTEREGADPSFNRKRVEPGLSAYHSLLLGPGQRVDLRKLPARTRRLAAARIHRDMMKLQAAWKAWILGNGEKPP